VAESSFSWDGEMTQREIILYLDFTNPEQISSSNDRDIMRIDFDSKDAIRAAKGGLKM